MSETSIISFNSFNTRGLGDVVKRKLIFTWLYENHKGITLLQETHSTANTEKLWKKQWDGEIVFSHGTSNSRGVATLFSSNLQYTIMGNITDNEGRIIVTHVEVDGQEVIVCNIYAPTKDKPKEQQLFLNNLREMLLPHIDKDILIGGDFNVCLFPEIDKKGGVQENQSTYAKDIISFLEEFQLADIWRLRHPTLRRFSRREKTTGGYVQSRLDFWLISMNLEFVVKKTDIIPGRRSDHSLVRLEMKLQNTDQRGKGFWRLNTSLLKDEIYLTEIRGLIKNLKVKYKSLTDKNLLWDTMKCEIRTETISYAIKKSKQNKQMESELKERLSKLEAQLAEEPNDNLQSEYNVVSSELDGILTHKARGAMLRSRAKWIEDGEKNTSYFLKLEHRNHKLKSISSLYTNTGEIITGRKEILQEEQRYYQHLYSNKDSRSNDLTHLENHFLNNPSIPKLTNEEQEMCDSPLILDECSVALKDLPNGKSPGSDGLPAEFYKMFWSDISSVVIDSYLFSLQEGEMSIDQRRGIITLIPKPDKDKRSLTNWRPITLLNTDYKILTKALANRLQGLISNLIHTDQTGYIKGRYIGENIRTIADIIDYCEMSNEQGFMVLLDFQKAFDSISWNFLQKSLKAFNFGDAFCNWIQTLYCNISSCVTNNGHSSTFFPVERGVRQGCPISPLLFIIAAEILACKIRSDDEIKGITIGDEVFTISQLADDTTLFLSDSNSLKHAFTLLDEFSIISGLLLNKGKTQMLHLGHIRLKIPDNMGIKLIEGSFKTLGVWFSNDREIMYQTNFNNCIDKIACQLNIWRQRGLSLKGKITVLKSLAISKLIYISSMLAVPVWFINKVDNLFFNFLWDGKPSKIKKSTIIGEIAEGGLKMPLVDGVVRSLKLSWVSRLINEKNTGRWKKLSATMLGMPLKDIASKMQSRYLSQNLTPFYKQALDIWYTIYSAEPLDDHIPIEKLWRNSHILIEEKPIIKGYKHWEQNGIVFLQDILNLDSGELLTHGELCNKFHSIHIDIMKYNSLVSAIPQRWRSVLKSQIKPIVYQHVSMEEQCVPKLYYKHRLIPVTSLRNKDFYIIMVDRYVKPPTAVNTWCALYPDITDFNWAEIYCLPYKTVRSTKLQSFQYKIVNRIFACKQNLAKWKLADDELCLDCAIPESIEHYFFDCHTSYTVWKQFESWFHNATNVSIKLDVLTIIFGTGKHGDVINDNILFLMDFCILVGKWYIFRQKYLNKSPSFIGFLVELRSCLEVEKYAFYIEGKHEEFRIKWNVLYDSF